MVLGCFIVLDFIVGIAFSFVFVVGQMGHQKAMAVYNWSLEISTRPFPIGVPDITNVLLQLAFIGVLITRFARTRREEQRLANEVEAARAVQHIMVPDQIPALAHLQVEALYRPATEVGGDFFQVIPLQTESVLIAVGDVSGKGMPAAMTVSFLVGTLRALTRTLDSPSQLLEALNEQLVARSEGFTTCVLARFDSGRAVTLANAGHLAPYLCGQELPMEPGLPLGIVLEATYAETTLPLRPGERITFVTDGVVEATSAQGELFGFERTRALSGQTAQAIAGAAQDFGQEDDITVLTVQRTAA